MLSPPGWALSIIAILTIVMQAPNIYNPSAFMTEFNLTNKPAAQLIGQSTHSISVFLHRSLVTYHGQLWVCSSFHLHRKLDPRHSNPLLRHHAHGLILFPT